MEANKYSPPLSDWRANRRMRASAWSGSELTGPDQICRTLARPGDFAPDDASPSWSFHLGLPDSLGKPQTIQLANGFAFKFPQLAEPPRITCLAIDRGIYVGSTSLDLRPTLFSPGTEVESEGDDQWVRLADQTVLLRIRKEDAGTRFALCIARGADDVTTQAADDGLAAPVDERLEAECGLRAAFWNSLEELDGDVGMLADAAEEIVFQLEAPTGEYTHRWSAAGIPDGNQFDVNQLYPLVKTWQSLDASIARELVAGVLTAVEPDGFLPAAFVPGQPKRGSTAAAWPYLARAVEAVADAPMAKSASEALRSYLNGIVEQLNPTHSGLLCWRSAGESFIPDTFDDQIASPALGAFLVAEFDAFERIAGMGKEIAGLSGELLDSRERIIAQLESSLWNTENEIYRDRYLSGATTSRDTLAGVMPLCWSGMPENRRASLLEKVSSQTYFGDPDGVPLWQEWENDPTPPPISAGFQFLLLDAMGEETDQATRGNLEDRVAGAIVRHKSANQVFPTQLRASAQLSGQEASPLKGIDAPVIGACLALTVLPAVYRRKGGESVSQFWVTLDRHRLSIVASVIGVVGLLVIGTALNLARKPTVKNPSSRQTTGLVQELMRQGKLAEALKLLEENRDDSDQDDTWLTRANIYFRMGDYASAEKEYRAMIERNVRLPNASVNLALTLFKQGEFDDAADQYDRCREQFAATHPEVVERAEEASRFIRVYRDTLVPEK